MSAKQAKRLRKAAMGLVVAVTEAGRTVQPRQLLAQEHRAPIDANFSSASQEDIHPKERVDEPKGKLIAITAINRPDSFRGIVRSIKKGLKNGSIPSLPAQHKVPPIL